MRSEPNSRAWASANEKAFSLCGNSVAKRMVEGFVQPGLNKAAMGTSLWCVQIVPEAVMHLRCFAALKKVIWLTLQRLRASEAACALPHFYYRPEMRQVALPVTELCSCFPILSRRGP